MIGRQLSHFRILAKLGEGGMGVVYRAEDTSLKRHVALKVLPPELVANEERRLRFLREARAAAAVTHPNIATVYEVGEAPDGSGQGPGIVFIAMELVEGRTLRDQIGGRPMPVKDAVRVATQVAEGLARAHQAGVIHRDLKPENVVVGDDGHVKILDFGLAKLLDERRMGVDADASQLETISGEMTQEGRIFGTTAYMSPEQARGQKVDPRSDVFSFGTTLYEMLAGRLPFQGRTATDTLSAIVRDEPAPLSRLNYDVPVELERITGKCLEKNPAERYQHTDDLVVDLRRLKRTTDSGVQVLRDGVAPARRSRPMAYRVASIVAVAAVLALIVLGGFVISRRAPRSPLELTQRQLTANPVGMDLIDAAISPDGRYLAYADHRGLQMQVIETGETHPLALPADFRIDSVAWYPDGTRLLLSAFHPGRTAQVPSGSLWSLSVLGGAPRRLQDGVWAGAVSPDGSRIAFLSVKAGSPPRELWGMGPNGEDPRRLVKFDRGQSAWWVGWSPDGSRIVCGKWSFPNLSSQAEIETRDRDGGDPRMLVAGGDLLQDWHGVLRGVWLPGGRLIYARAEASQENDSNLWEVWIDPASHRAAGEPRRVSDWAGYSVRQLSTTADGKRLVFLRKRQQPDVYVGEIARGSRRLERSARLTLDERHDYPSAWSYDGSAVYFGSNRAGNWDIFLQRPGEATPQGIIVGPGDETAPSLSPGGEDLLYWTSSAPDLERGGASIWQLMKAPLSGGSPEPLPGTKNASAGFECARVRGGRCALSEVSETQITFFELDLAGGRGPEIGRVGVDPAAFCNWDLSPDGKRVAVVNFSNQVSILELAGGQTRVLQSGWGNIELAAWTADGRGVIVNGSGPTGTSGLLYLGLDGRSEVVWQKEEEWPTFVVPSPDGRRLAYASMISESNAWLVEKF